MRAVARIRTSVTEAFLSFIRTQASSGIILIAATLIALVLANTSASQAYRELWARHFILQAGRVQLDLSLHHWINDGLMAIFFLLVGLEMKRELLHGELASVRKAALPAIAALGGMIVPACLYFLLTRRTPFVAGWGIPMATDIAFAVGILALLGPRVPVWLKVYLTALAIVDDLGAVVMISIFYTGTVSFTVLGYAGGAVLGLLALNLLRVRRLRLYLPLGVLLWLAFLHSGIHASIAGVVVGMMIPTTVRLPPDAFIRKAEQALSAYCTSLSGPDSEEDRDAAKEAREHALEQLSRTALDAVSPLHRLEHSLHGWVAFAILPLFALSNAGVKIPWTDIGPALRHPVTLGVMLGLFLGKQAGIFLASYLAVKLRLGDLPKEGTFRQVYGAAVLGGIGFTMSIFIAHLAFAQESLLDFAKIGILSASLLSAVCGTLVLALGMRQDRNS